MQGGYNIATLVELLDDAELANTAAEQLKHTLLMFDAFHDVAERAKKGNAAAKSVLQSWADGEWFKAAGSPGKADSHRIQGPRRNQHRRPLPGPRRLVAPGHPAARPGHAEDGPRRHRAGPARVRSVR